MDKSVVYTRTGDAGTTSLVTGQRVRKNNVRVEAYGVIDELNAQVGVLHADCMELPREVLDMLVFISNKLFVLGAYLAADIRDGQKPDGLDEGDVERLEKNIDAMDGALPKLNCFVLPLGARAAADAHVARTICRRGERRILTLADTGAYVDNVVLAFVNRLSDYFFVLSRYINIATETPEIPWQK